MVFSSSFFSETMLPVGFILKEKYKILGHIDSWGFGNTYLAVTIANNVRVAVKEFFIKNINAYDDNHQVIVYNKNNQELFQKQMKKFFNEAQTQACINNSHVVNVTESFLCNQTAYYVMEFVDGQTLAQIIKTNGKPLDNDKAIDIFLQVIDALFAIHNKGILHLDIKPSNIMVDRMGTAKIIDFGTAKVAHGENDTISTFTPAYAPMEVHQQRPDAIGPWTDIYSLGATLYYIITAKKPPQETDIVDMGEKAFSFNENTDEMTRRLIVWMMKSARKERPQNVTEILKFMETGVLPRSREDEEHTMLHGEDSPFATVYNDNDEGQQQTVAERGGQGRKGDDVNGKRKKSHAGCWVFIILTLITAAVGYYLYDRGVLDKWFTREKQEIIVNDDSIQEINDSVNQERIKLEQEINYYDAMHSLLDEMKEKVERAQTEEEIDSLAKELDEKWNKTNRQYDGVELTDYHQNTLVKIMEELEKQIQEKLQTIQEEELLSIISNDDESSSSIEEDNSTEIDEDSLEQQPVTEEDESGDVIDDLLF